MKKILFSLLLMAGVSAVNVAKAQYVVFQDSFEGYSDFAIANVGDWTLTDVDQSLTYGFNGITFPNSGVAKSFQVFNSTTTTPAMTPSSTSDWTAKTGSKAMVSFAAILPADGGSGPNNDWLISPQIQLKADGGTLGFWAKACDKTYYQEKFRVYVSTTGTAVSDFTAISAVTTTANSVAWKEYTYSLSAYAGQKVYIAIQCTSNDRFGFAVDDFKVTTSIAPVTAPDCATLSAPANGATGISYASAGLAWAQSPGADSYDVYLDTTNASTLVGNVSAAGYTATNLNPSTTYYWKVIPKNTVGAATGCTVYSFTTTELQYCTASATSTSTLFERIDNVQFANISNSSPSTGTVGYEDFTQVVGNVEQGKTYTLTVNSDEGVYDSDEVIAWIDFNGDKDFDDDGEMFLLGTGGGPTWTKEIAIPSNAKLGNTRMRIRLHDAELGGNPAPCGTSTYGQVEDYTLSIGALAVSETAKQNIKAYPNPVKDIFNIEAQGKIKSVKVFDISGKQLLTKELNEAKSQIDFSRFNPGVYIVTTQLEDGTTTSNKVIKK